MEYDIRIDCPCGAAYDAPRKRLLVCPSCYRTWDIKPDEPLHPDEQSVMGKLARSDFLPNVHYFIEEGKLFLSPFFLKKTNACCKQECKYCPYGNELADRDSMATALNGNIIGTTGSWENAGNTLDKAFLVGGFFDSPDASGDWVGLDLNVPASVTSVTFAPRKGFEPRLVGGQFQGSNDETTWSTFYKVPALVTGLQTVKVPSASYRYLRYLGPDYGNCNIGSLAFYGTSQASWAQGSPITTGTVIGTVGSWDNLGNTAAKAFTPGGFFDAPVATGDWCGLNFGSPFQLTNIQFAPRPGFHARMVGGVFQTSLTPDFANPSTIYTIGQLANDGVCDITVTATAAQYFRYLGPANSYCNIGSISVYGSSQPVVIPSTPTVALPIVLKGQVSSTANQHIGQEPAVGFIDLRGIASVTDDVVTIDFGDVNNEIRPDYRHQFDSTYPATFSMNTDLQGVVEGHLYEMAGTYTITATVKKADGSLVVATNTVIVDVDSRTHWWLDSINGLDSNDGSQAHPLKSDAMFAKHVGQLNTWVHVAIGSTFNVPVSIRMLSNSVVQGEGKDQNGNCPKLNSQYGEVFDTWYNQSDGFVIRGFYFDSASTVVVKSGVNCYQSNYGTVGLTNRGTSGFVGDNQLGCVAIFYKGFSAANCGLMIVGNVQMSNVSINGQVVGEWSGGVESWIGNYITGAYAESPFRSDGEGAAVGFSCQYNYVAQELANVDDKAALTNRNAQDSLVAKNVFKNGPVGLSCSIGSTVTWIKRAHYRDNLHLNSEYDIGSRVDTIKVSLNNMQLTGTPGFNIASNTPTPTDVSNIRFENNRGTANSVRIYYDHNGVTNVTADVPIQ
jgi:hypothetical protein